MTASSLTQVAGALTVVWLASHLAVPRATPSMPRVAMNGTTRRRVMARPFTRPTSPPARIGGQDREGRGPAVAQGEGAQDAGERDRRADGEVDPAADDDEGHADRADRHDHGLGEDHAQVVGGQVALGRAAREREEGHHEQEADEGAEADQAVPQLASHAPIAASRTVSGVHSATGRAGPRRPRLITASRSHTPRSSGR